MKERKCVCKMCGNEYTTSAPNSKYCHYCITAAGKYRQMQFLKKHPTYNRDYAAVRRMGKNLYMACTDDEYELPIAVADTATELAQMVGITNE